MRIAFDLDNTLIPYGSSFRTLEPDYLMRLLGAEGLRIGTRELINELRKEGHEIYVYTSSFRTVYNIRRTFRAHGIKLDGVVNQERHNRRLRERKLKHTKYPPAFDIDILIDDSKGVELEGELHGFAVIQIDPEDQDWAGKVRAAVNSYISQG